MVTVYFDRPKSKVDPNRDANTLLLAQVQHLREAEKNLPPKYHSGIFSQAIRTEGEAADYVKRVTEAIHRAHRDAAAARTAVPVAKPRPRPSLVDDIAAVADAGAQRKRSTRRKTSMKSKPAKKKSSRRK